MRRPGRRRRIRLEQALFRATPRGAGASGGVSAALPGRAAACSSHWRPAASRDKRCGALAQQILRPGGHVAAPWDCCANLRPAAGGPRDGESPTGDAARHHAVQRAVPHRLSCDDRAVVEAVPYEGATVCNALETDSRPVAARLWVEHSRDLQLSRWKRSATNEPGRKCGSSCSATAAICSRRCS